MSSAKSPSRAEKQRILTRCEEADLEEVVGYLEKWKQDEDVVLATLESIYNAEPDQVRLIM